MVCLLDEVDHFGEFKHSDLHCVLCQLSPSWPPVCGISGNPHRQETKMLNGQVLEVDLRCI